MDLPDLVADLHGAVADPDDWERVLGKLCLRLGGARLILGAIRAEAGGFDMQGIGVDPDFLQRSAEVLAFPDNNPWNALVPQLSLRQLATEDELGPRARFEDSRVWRDFYQPLAIVEAAGGILERSATTLEIAMFGKTEAFSRADHQLVAGLLPHLARAWRIRRALTQWQGLAASLASALDRLDRGVIISTPDGRIRFANREADRMLTDGGRLTVRQGRLGGADPRESAGLRKLISDISAAGSGERLQPSAAVPLGDTDENGGLVVVAEPITPPHCEVLRQPGIAGAILFLGGSATRARMTADRLRNAYALTPAQAELAARLVDGAKLIEAAAALGVSENTARTHLKAIFQRVGVNRQAELVARVLADVGGLAEEAGHGPGGPPRN